MDPDSGIWLKKKPTVLRFLFSEAEFFWLIKWSISFKTDFLRFFLYIKFHKLGRIRIPNSYWYDIFWCSFSCDSSQHEKAVLYFQRALKLNPGYLSALTLIGHEYMEMKVGVTWLIDYCSTATVQCTLIFFRIRMRQYSPTDRPLKWTGEITGKLSHGTPLYLVSRSFLMYPIIYHYFFWH